MCEVLPLYSLAKLLCVVEVHVLPHCVLHQRPFGETQTQLSCWELPWLDMMRPLDPRVPGVQRTRSPFTTLCLPLTYSSCQA